MRKFPLRESSSQFLSIFFYWIGEFFCCCFSDWKESISNEQISKLKREKEKRKKKERKKEWKKKERKNEDR